MNTFSRLPTVLVPLSIRRQTVISVLFFVGFLCPSIYAKANDIEPYPYSGYGMYKFDKVGKTEFSASVLVGVTKGGNRIHLRETQYIEPFQQGRLRRVLGRFSKDSVKAKKKKKVLQFLLKRYNRRRREGLHDGRYLRELRVYKYTWDLTEKGRKLARPNSKTLKFSFKPEKKKSKKKSHEQTSMKATAKKAITRSAKAQGRP